MHIIIVNGDKCVKDCRPFLVRFVLRDKFPGKKLESLMNDDDGISVIFYANLKQTINFKQ